VVDQWLGIANTCSGGVPNTAAREESIWCVHLRLVCIANCCSILSWQQPCFTR